MEGRETEGSSEGSPIQRDIPTLDAGTPTEHRARGGRAPVSLAERSQLGRYEVMGTLGSGGMGVVLKAFDPIQRSVALKVLHGQIDERQAARLEREAQAMARVSYPNVVQVYEVGQVDGLTFVAMELVSGQTLREWIRQEPRPDWRRCVEVFVDAGLGLAAAHEQGLVHRDFKPGNTIIDGKGRLRVLDFGLARQVDVPSTFPLSSDVSVDTTSMDAPLTRTGALVGTPAYMSPEQMRGEEVDARSDQFSFCVALHEAIHGTRPFGGRSIVERLNAIEDGRIERPRRSAVPASVDSILVRGMARDPRGRWPSMEVLVDRLQAVIVPRHSRRVTIGLAVGALGIAGGLVLQARYAELAEQTPPCTGAAKHLDGIWDQARRQEVEAALLGTELSYAPSTWVRVESHLDAYTQAWIAKHQEVCEATRVTGEQTEAQMSLRMECLHRRRAALDAAVGVMVVADTTMMDRVLGLVSELPELSRCDDLEWLDRQRQRVPPPDDPRAVYEVQSLREELQQIAAQQSAGRYTDALARIEGLVDRADALGYGPVIAELESRRGQILEDHGDYDEAEQALNRAYELSVTHDHERIEMESSQSLASVVGSRFHRYAEGLQWGRTARLLAERVGEPTDVALSLSTLSSIHSDQGRHEEAEALLRKALDLRNDEEKPDLLGVSALNHNLGLVLSRQGKTQQAEHLQRRVVELRETGLGPEHPQLASGLYNLGLTLKKRGENEDAREAFRRALSIWESSLGPNAPRVIMCMGQLGVIAYALGEEEEALRMLERGVARAEVGLGPEHSDLARILDEYGSVRRRRGEYALALALYQRAAKVRERALGSQHPILAGSLNNVAQMLAKTGDHQEAERQLRRALQILEQTVGPDHHYVVLTLENLGGVLAEQRQFEPCREHLTRALGILESDGPTDDPAVVGILIELASCEAALDDAEAARAHAQRVIERSESHPVDPIAVARARFLLASILVSDRDQQTEALRLAEQAQATFAEHGDEVRLRRVRAWLDERERTER